VISIVTTTVEFNRQTLPFRTDCFIAGTHCLLSTNSHDILQAASQWRPSTTHGAASSFEMQIVVDSSRDRLQERAPHFRGLRHLVFAYIPPRSFLTFDLLRRRVQAVLSVAASTDTFFWTSLLIPIAIGVLGTTVGLVPLHCACLDRRESGFLVAGDSGAGKSTLAAALAWRGFTLVSDDWTYLSKQQSTLIAHGLAAPMKLLPETVRFFPELRKFTPKTTLNGELAYELDPRTSFDFKVKSFSYPQHIFFLERTPVPGCHMVPCAPEYVSGFFQRSAERLPDELPDAKAFRTGTIQSLSAHPAWIVRTGESPQVTAQAIDDFLLEAVHASV
jgi:hypothetical protein